MIIFTIICVDKIHPQGGWYKQWKDLEILDNVLNFKIEVDVYTKNKFEEKLRQQNINVNLVIIHASIYNDLQDKDFLNYYNKFQKTPYIMLVAHSSCSFKIINNGKVCKTNVNFPNNTCLSYLQNKLRDLIENLTAIENERNISTFELEKRRVNAWTSWEYSTNYNLIIGLLVLCQGFLAKNYSTSIRIKENHKNIHIEIAVDTMHWKNFFSNQDNSRVIQRLQQHQIDIFNASWWLEGLGINDKKQADVERAIEAEWQNLSGEKELRGEIRQLLEALGLVGEQDSHSEIQPEMVAKAYGTIASVLKDRYQ